VIATVEPFEMGSLVTLKVDKKVKLSGQSERIVARILEINPTSQRYYLLTQYRFLNDTHSYGKLNPAHPAFNEILIRKQKLQMRKLYRFKKLTAFAITVNL
jgi:hypothetical protein